MPPYRPNAARYGDMTYRRCGNSGMLLPAVSLGLWHNFGAVDPFATARATVRRAFDVGITHFDLANSYGPPPGSAELTFGRILRRDLARHRDELIVSTKAGYLMWPGPYGDWGSRKYLRASLDQSLAQMALAWTLRHASVTSALVGASRPAHVADAVLALSNLTFSGDELTAIDRILTKEPPCPPTPSP